MSATQTKSVRSWSTRIVVLNPGTEELRVTDVIYREFHDRRAGQAPQSPPTDCNGLPSRTHRGGSAIQRPGT
jgi:hypothetical protein